MTTHYLYLHGFASSPASTKARDFAARFASIGLTLHVPDLNVPSFEQITLTAMLEQVAETIRALPEGDVVLLGSSMGGATAIHFADRDRQSEAARVKKLFLMAPAFDFAANRWRELGESGIQKWREQGMLEFFNFAAGGLKPVHYGLYEDLQRYDSYSLKLDLPILIFHGLNDVTVEIEQSRQFAATRPNVDLREVDSDHQLLDQTEVMWAALRGFLALN